MEKTKQKSSSLSGGEKCGGCEFQGMPYAEQLRHKEKRVRILLDSFGKVHPIIGMKDPYHYRNKVHAVFDRDRRGNAISGVYQKGTHKVVPVDSCMIEDQKADEIIVTIRGLLKSFKIKTYDEDTQYGLLRHVLIRHGFSTGRSWSCSSRHRRYFHPRTILSKHCEKFIRRLRRSFRISTTGEPAWYLEHETSFSMERIYRR